MTITTEVTFADLRAQYDDELDDLRAAYEDTVALARERYGDDAMQTNPSSVDNPDDLARLQQTAEAYNEAGKSTQQRQHALETLTDEYDGDTFTVAMLSGSELMDIETELRMLAQSKDVDPSIMQAKRKGMVVDKATVDAPEGLGDPSDAPNPITLSLYDVVERLNQGGTPDFRAPGFGDDTASEPSSTSVTPTTSEPLSTASATTDESAPTSGDDS